MQPLTATAAKPPDDIDAVLGRFQAWSASRKTTGKTLQKAAPKKSDVLPDGVRELSHEEALESSRSRWQARTKPSVICDSTGELPTSADGKSVPAVTQGKSEPEAFPAAAFNAEAIQPDKLSLTSAGPPVHTTAPPEKSVAPAFGTVLAKALPAEPDPNPDLGPLALVWPAPPKNERQVSMSLRVAASEQALIKARAAEAGLSVSAYLCQCALEVEKLRAQVHHTLALLEQKSEQRSELSPARSLIAGPPTPPPGRFFARVGQLLFGSPGRLTLRA
jgi:hypothetical protein